MTEKGRKESRGKDGKDGKRTGKKTRLSIDRNTCARERHTPAEGTPLAVLKTNASLPREGLPSVCRYDGLLPM